MFKSPVLQMVHDLKTEPAIKRVASEKIVNAGHLCQDHPEVIEEVRRILSEHRDADRAELSGLERRKKGLASGPRIVEPTGNEPR